MLGAFLDPFRPGWAGFMKGAASLMCDVYIGEGGEEADSRLFASQQDRD